MAQITDIYKRTFKTLRVSLLNNCNLGCVYCVAGEESPAKHHITIPKSTSEADNLLATIKKLHTILGLETIRLTGGEPLLYPDLLRVASGIRDMGIPQIKLTTNAFLLARMAKQLKEAGVQSINVSLDAVDEDIFFLMSRRSNVNRIIQGIDAAIEAGLQVKMNSVVMKGINQRQILPLLTFAFERKIPIRFLEIMAMGHLYGHAEKYLFTQEEILNTIAAAYQFQPVQRSTSATANYWQTQDGNSFGIIANESEPFCHDCNRLRLDSAGNIYGCLSNNHPIPFNHTLAEEVLHEKLMEALLQKQAVKFTGSALSMLQVGG